MRKRVVYEAWFREVAGGVSNPSSRWTWFL